VSKKAIQLPLNFIIFLIVIIVVVALLLVWNFSGIKLFTDVFGSANEVVTNVSGGAVSTLAP